ncbi:4-oxalocrotonate tautomerase [Curvibacter sp. HBC28]|uniref:4-oxalocrotonate tautomerase n=1 Tax=Curvibacter microcysteis TaxID=3026419 RepID=A0ABT5MK57_9BURK|nr:4-oxalocrotonate tautomerase [Curvibacter sp. HBC28]MDD0816379.1 4-oxalocrotonate tautomerase [Curvibacter sp. HBC28]
MPHIVIHLSGQADPALARQVCDRVCEITHRVLGKVEAVMATNVQFMPADTWFIGRQSLAELGQNAYHLDISVSDETNTKAEKARFLHEVHTAMTQLLPRLHPVSYVHVIDARAAAYGYGGHSQEWRHQQAGV